MTYRSINPCTTVLHVSCPLDMRLKVWVVSASWSISIFCNSLYFPSSNKALDKMSRCCCFLCSTVDCQGRGSGSIEPGAIVLTWQRILQYATKSFCRYNNTSRFLYWRGEGDCDLQQRPHPWIYLAK